MHPLELQVTDLKNQLATKDAKLKAFETTFRIISKDLEEIKEMLHPSRQKRVDLLKQKVDASLGG